MSSYVWSRKSDLNRRPAAYKAAALPTELLRLITLRASLLFYMILRFLGRFFVALAWVGAMRRIGRFGVTFGAAFLAFCAAL